MLGIIFLIAIIQNTVTSQQQCPLDCRCQDFTVLCNNTRNTLENLTIALGTTKLSLINMALNNDTLLSQTLANLEELKELDISNNAFTDVPIETIKMLPKLVKLTLRRNLVTKLPLGLQQISSEIIIDLSENQLICSCETVCILNDDPRRTVLGDCVFPFRIPLASITTENLNCDTCQQQRCKQNVCQNGGTCFEDLDKNFTCTCPLDTSGRTCDKLEGGGLSTTVVVGVTVPIILLVLAAFVVWYLVRLRPKRRSKKRSKNEKVKVQFKESNTNGGYSRDLTYDDTKEPAELYPHDHQRWLSRRRCSTVLEVEERASREGSCLEEGTTPQEKSVTI